jgi:hypothetical protein
MLPLMRITESATASLPSGDMISTAEIVAQMGAARQVAQALNDEATFLLLQMANFAARAKNRDGFAPEWRPVQQIRRICGGIRRD